MIASIWPGCVTRAAGAVTCASTLPEGALRRWDSEADSLLKQWGRCRAHTHLLRLQCPHAARSTLLPCITSTFQNPKPVLIIITVSLTCCLLGQPSSALPELPDAVAEFSLREVRKCRVKRRQEAARGAGAVLKVAFEARGTRVAHQHPTQLPHDPVGGLGGDISACAWNRKAGVMRWNPERFTTPTINPFRFCTSTSLLMRSYTSGSSSSSCSALASSHSHDIWPP